MKKIILALFLFSATLYATTERLPDAIIGNGQWIVADMDGTLIEAPSYKREPTLEESVAKEAIFDWLRAGGHLLLLTGSETTNTFKRFSQFIPKDLREALVERRLLIATNGGCVLSYFDGAGWKEETNYQYHALKTPIVITNESTILENVVTVINHFYRDLREDKIPVPEQLQKKISHLIDIAKNKHPDDFTFQELDTLDTDVVPRIEVRRTENQDVVQIVVLGIHVDLNYDVSGFDLDEETFQITKVNFTHEINLKGVDKSLPIRWMHEDREEKSGYPYFDKEKSVAIGDRPNHNDGPLTKSVAAFVSVSEYDTPAYIPPHVTLKIGGNQAGSKKLIEGLLKKAEAFNANKQYEPVIIPSLKDVVDEIKANNR